MHTRTLSVVMALTAACAAAAEPRADTVAVPGTVGATAPASTDGALLCRTVAAARQNESVPKESVTATRALCNSLAESVGKCAQLENTVVWLGLWQPGQSADSPVYTNRLDFAELQRRISRLTDELAAHADQLQTLIRRQNAIGP